MRPIYIYILNSLNYTTNTKELTNSQTKVDDSGGIKML